jgi:hypothetical protein
MPLPFLPPGQTSLPAERFILFADPSNDVQRIDEASVQKDGGSFTSEWQSGTLNRVEEGKTFELALLDIFYSAFATTISVAGSGDGGETWGPDQVATLVLTPDKIETVRVGLGVTGTDLRFRILFDTDILVNIYGFRPHLVERGDLIF